MAFGLYWPHGSLVGIPYCGSVMMWTMAGQFVMSSILVQDSHSSEMSLQRGPAPEPGGAPEVPSWPCRAQPPRAQLAGSTLSPTQPWLGHCFHLIRGGGEKEGESHAEDCCQRPPLEL